MRTKTYENLVSCMDSELEVISFLHNTSTQSKAENILKDGFVFKNYLDYSCDVFYKVDPISIKYFLSTRRAYGEYTVLIQISAALIGSLKQDKNDSAFHFSELISKKISSENGDDETSYLLPARFCKAYINQANGKVVLNKNFNPKAK